MSKKQRKLALGLFHFNVQYVAGSISSYHRYCTQAILPFLEVFQRNRSFRASFELCGSGLEFLAKHYPTAFRDLRALSIQGQLEIISSLYTPSLWPAFPQRDLVKSVEINRRRITNLGLNAASIFFSQESFFGQGLRSIDGLFSAAVCKDELLRQQISAADYSHFFSLGRMRIVVGAGHMVNDLARAADINPGAPIGLAGLGVYGKRLRGARDSLPASHSESGETQAGDVSWLWYHMGSGHHFTTPHAPENSLEFFSDARWTSMNECLLRDLQAAGYALSTISEFLEETTNQPTVPLPPVVESSWNCEKSRGLFTWMNKQDRTWDRNTHILGLAWRSRHQLRKCEFLFERLPVEAQRATESSLEEVWTKQLMAESSDPCGWAPLPGEVRFGLDSAESALNAAESLRLKLTDRSEVSGPAARPLDEIGVVESSRCQKFPLHFVPSLLGADGVIEIYACDPRSVVCAMAATAVGAEAGVCFPLGSGTVVFCPSGLESEPSCVEIDRLLPGEIFLPLANGLIGIGEDLFVIRINRYGQPAVKIDRANKHIAFTIVGEIVGRPLTWRFILFCGVLTDAVRLANETNDV